MEEFNKSTRGNPTGSNRLEKIDGLILNSAVIVVWFILYNTGRLVNSLKLLCGWIKRKLFQLVVKEM